MVILKLMGASLFFNNLVFLIKNKNPDLFENQDIALFCFQSL
jgi:hypothetical protein